MSDNMPFLLVQNVTKVFPGVKALDNVTMEVRKGEVISLLGENGAGKSTLIKIISGVYRPDMGEIFINGEKVKITSTAIAAKNNIAVIFQEFNLINDLSVAENIFIGREHRFPGNMFINYRELNKSAQKILEELDISIDPKKLISELSVSEKQMVEIARALTFNSKLIIMDEPTATLSGKEVNKLFDIIKELKKKGISIIYISHRLEEAFILADRVVVLRDGKIVGTKDIKKITENEIIEMMVGNVIKDYFEDSVKVSKLEEKVIMEVKNYSISGYVDKIDFKLHKGEIVAFAGIIGSGVRELFRSLYGLIPSSSGEILIDNQKVVIESVQSALKNGIGFITDDRKEEGIIPDLSVLENLSIIILKSLTSLKGLLINLKKEKNIVNKIKNRLKIKFSNYNQKIIYLSGGNQQKVVFGKTLLSNCKILILAEPTRGIDVGTKAEIHKILRELAEQGISVLLTSSELAELINLPDRCIVLYKGKKVADLSRDIITEDKIVAAQIGK